MAILLALDFGGTKHTAGVVAWPFADKKPPTWLNFERQNSILEANADSDLDIMFSLARKVLEGKKPAAIGISFGGPVNYTKQQVILSHHVPGWNNIGLGELFQDEFDCTVIIDNDANMAAIGEYTFGAGVGLQSLMYITVSTGVGGGILFNDELWHGANSMAGEIGHTVVDPNGPLCLCGKHGCVERLASGPFIAQDAVASLDEYPEKGPILRQLAGDNPDQVTASLINQAAELGDELAINLLDRSAYALGVGIGNTANLINPNCFILGGGVTKSGDRYWREIHQAARKTALPQVHFEILPAALGDDAPLWGAIVSAEQCLSSLS